MIQTGVYTPSSPYLRTLIAPGSAIVCSNDDKEYRVIYFEGNIHGSENIVTFADRALIAGGREREQYPTAACMLVVAEEIHKVGTFDGTTVDVTDPDALREWIGEYDDAELTISS